MTIFLFAINYYLSLLNVFFLRHKKIILILFPLTLIILMGGNNSNPDYLAYKYYYESGFNEFEIGYELLSKLACLIGINYNGFRILLAILGITLIYSTIKKIVGNKATIFYMLYALYPFMIDVTQIRNFIAMSIVIFSFRYLVEKTIYSNVKYFIFILIASMFQTIALAYLPIFIFLKIKKTYKFKIVLFISIICLLVLSVTPLFQEVLSQFLLTIVGGNKNLYIQNKNPNYILYWIIHFFNIILLVYANQKSKNINVDLKIKNIINIILWINIYLAILMPVFVFEMTFTRLTRNIFPLNIIAFVCMVYYVLKNKSISKIVYIVIFVLFSLFLFWFDIYSPFTDTIVNALFEHNWILNID